MKKKIILVLIILTVILFFSFPNFYKHKINYTILGDKQLFTNNIISKNFSDLIYDELIEKDKIIYNKDFINNDVRITNAPKNNLFIERRFKVHHNLQVR